MPVVMEDRVEVRPTISNESRSENSGQDSASLLMRYARTRDPELKARIVTLHENLVRYLAGKFANRGEPLDDLIQVGMIGLLNAIDRFEPDRGLKFATYATPTIVGEIKRYFRDKAWSVSVPRRLKELSQSAEKARQTLSGQFGRTPTIAEVAAKIGASEEETLEALELGTAYSTVSLDAPVSNPVDSGEVSWAECLGMTDEGLTAVTAHSDLRAAIDHLDERERAIVIGCFFNELSQAEVAKRLSISQMHVSRLQKRAIEHLREILGREAEMP